MSTKRVIGGVMVLPFLLGIVAGGSVSGFGFLIAVLGIALILSTYMRKN